MIAFEILGHEHDPVYQELEVANGDRLRTFLDSIIDVSLKARRQLLSQQVVKAFNFHAICCLHIGAGEYRPCEVHNGVMTYMPQYRVPAAMDDFVNLVNRDWIVTDPLVLAAYVLWRINFIHPFINGNGRTARATAYYVICVRLGGRLRGTVTLPDLLKRDSQEYVTYLRHADKTNAENGAPDLAPLHQMIVRLIQEQLASAIPSTTDLASATVPAG